MTSGYSKNLTLQVVIEKIQRRLRHSSNVPTASNNNVVGSGKTDSVPFV